MRFPEVAEQLDTGTVLALKGPADGWAFPQGSAGDYMALTAQALEADPGGLSTPRAPQPRAPGVGRFGAHVRAQIAPPKPNLFVKV